MAKEMLINVSEGEECRIALLDDGKLDELYMERTSSTSHVGNIYKGRVTNVEASIQAAFIDFGLGRNGFLHISDLMPSYFGRGGNDIQESVGKKMARRDRPPIQRCLRRGDDIIVQIIKEGIGTKGPTLSTYLSIPGRILVMMPGMGKMGVSKKIEDEEERRRLRAILDSLKPPKGVGFIIRTAGIGKSKAEIQRDLTYLSRLWMQIEKKRTSGSGPMELYTEGDLVARTVRDVYSGDIDRLVVDNAEVAKRVKEVIKITSPRTKNKLEVYEEPIPLFHKYGIEKDIELMYSRHVPLPSGGSLVIDSTEAIVAIDVNSGKFRDHSDAEMTAFKTDMEAADEIPRQLKLRDLGGVIICDFIDLRYERHRRELEERLHENFKKDRAKTKVLRMSQFGIIEITRQRMRPSLKRSIYFDCPHCKGAGLVKTPESMSLDVMRKLAIAAHNERVARLELAVCPDVGFYLLNKKRASLHRLEAESRKKIFVRTEASLGLDEIKLTTFDGRDGVIILEELGLTAQPPHTSQLHTRPAGHKGRRGRDRDRGRGGRGRDDRQQQPRGGRDEDFDMDEAEDALEEREVRRERTPADDALAAAIAPKIVRDEKSPPATEEVEGELEAEVVEDQNDEAPAEAEAAEAEAVDAEEVEQVEEEENVVDVDDGPSELGDRPAGEWDRQGYGGGGGGGGGSRRRRGRRGGRGGRDDRGDGRDQPRQESGGGGAPQPQQRQQGGQAQPRDQRDQRDNRGGQPPRAQPPRDQQPRDQQPRDQQPRDNRGGGGGGHRDRQPQHNRGPGGFRDQRPGAGRPSGGGRRDQRGGFRDQRGGNRGRDQRTGGGGFQHPMFKTPEALKAHEAELRARGEVVPPRPPNFPTGAGYQGHAGDYGGAADDAGDVVGGAAGGAAGGATGGAAGGVAGGAAGGAGYGSATGAGYGGAGYGGGGYGSEGGPRRRRRRGGRRHRRRRERERMERERQAAGLPPLPPDNEQDDYEGPPGAEQDQDQDREEQPVADRESEPPQREPEPEPVSEAEAPAEEEAPAPKKRRASSSRSKTSAAKPRRTAPRRSSKSATESKAPAVPEPPVVKTGSADKHLADDEPVDPDPQPARRPRRRDDLDAIPDDYD